MRSQSVFFEIRKGGQTKKTIGIVGEFYENFEPHHMLNQSLKWLQGKCDFNYTWFDTVEVDKNETCLKKVCGIWSAPGSPFKSLNGALKAIQFARENDIPHLATCAGFQHMIIEFARNVIGIKEAQHEEYDKSSDVLFISKLACSMAGQSMRVKIRENTVAYHAYKRSESTEDYYCNFGINPTFLPQLDNSNILVSGVDQNDEIRIIENPHNRFFVGTLFVPQTRSTEDAVHPLIVRFVEESTGLVAK